MQDEWNLKSVWFFDFYKIIRYNYVYVQNILLFLWVMKKFVIILFSILFIWWLCNADLAWYWIDSYTFNFKLRSDWILEINESIDVNFSEYRHGIYRTIPYIYSNYLKTPIEKIKVPWYKFETNDEWNNYMIKIWSKNKTVIGKQNYNIQYQIKWSVKDFGEYQELYWNVLWTERNTSVNNFNFTLELPSDLNLNDDEIWVYIWEEWSNKTSKAIKSWNIIRNAEPLNLRANEGVTLAVKLPINYVPIKKYYSLKWWFVYHSNVISIWIRSIVTLLLGFFSIRELVRRYKRRKELRQAHWRKIKNMVYYTPPKWYTAVDVAAIYDWKSNFCVFSVFLYSWISKWYVSIEEVETRGFLWLWRKKKYYFKSTTSNPKFYFDESININNYLHFSNPEERFWKLCFIQKDINDLSSFGERESKLLKKIADETFYQNHTKFIPDYKELYKVKRLSSNQYRFPKTFYGIVDYLDEKHYYSLNRFIFVLWIFISCWLFSVFLNNESLFAYFMLWIRWIAILYVVYLMIRNRTKDTLFKFIRWNIRKDLKYLSEEWVEVIEQILWFRKYLKTVDEEKLMVLLKNDKTYFEDILPYAIALNVWNCWIKKCMKILEKIGYSPEWISVSDNDWWKAITSVSLIWNSISSTVYSIDHPSGWWGGGWDRWSSSWWSSGWWSSGWWGWWGWWWSW